MTGLLAIERFLPPYRYDQEVVTEWVREWLAEDPASAARLLSVYATAGVKARASVVPIEQVFRPRDFEAQNDLYAETAKRVGVDLCREALRRAEIPAGDVGLVVSVSCTGFMIPAVDAYVADALGLGPRLARLPITESGCAGGVVGLARAHDYLLAHPDRAAVVLAVELSSLTFQRWDRSATNVVSTAIFGDGAAAVVLAGPEHPRARDAAARITATESVFFPGTTHLMGFRLRNPGLQIVLDRELAPFVRRSVADVVEGFLKPRSLAREDVTRWVLHPGGRKIIEVMAERLDLAASDLAPTEAVLSEHGNMSSVTVLF
ncbi:MAG TPA: type III polyketide synthase, partial [Vicinamibacteria bacterium]|nr:type III polyketide synthase [Vicinamibacteria bacterium]